jgi:hypothetical protein
MLNGQIVTKIHHFKLKKEEEEGCNSIKFGVILSLL